MKLARRLGIVACVLLLLALGGAIWLQYSFRASLALLDGEAACPGLTAPVEIERDALGVPTIRGASREDVARATGFLHGQERFFQMDLLRRRAAGELSELFGPGALALDREARRHRFRALAATELASVSTEHRAMLDAYAGGVNTALALLGAPPVEYLLLRAEPVAWLPEDSLLVVLAMYLELQDQTGRRETMLGLMRERLPEQLFDFLTGWSDGWDAPLLGEALESPGLPDAAAVDLRRQRPVVTDRRGRREIELQDGADGGIGSNNWAVAGTRTEDGGALLAADMHLRLGLPNIWFRASLVFPAEGDAEHQVTGVTLPGTPLVIAGSNGHVAWGFTNSYGDWSDVVLLDGVEAGGETYLTPDGRRGFLKFSETIRVKGEDDEIVDVRWTVWGPLLEPDLLGRPRALRWVAHDRQSVNLDLLGMETARSLEQALDAANRAAIPTQNCIVAASDGRIGWTLMGPLPRRVGFDGRWPVSWNAPGVGWDGYRSGSDYPRIVDPADGFLWTANNRVLDLPGQRELGDGGYAGGARARQIRDRLAAVDPASVADMLALQLDDRALFLERWRTLLLEVLTPGSIVDDPRRGELRRLADQDWSGHASVDSAGYRLVRAFRNFLAEQVFRALTRPCSELDPTFDYRSGGRFEGPLWRLVEERPLHLLDPQHADWDAQLLAAADATVTYFTADGAVLADQTWGALNTVRVQHPLSESAPQLGRWLDLAPLALPGDSEMPRVQGPSFGASQRMVVSPGREAAGLFHMPGGQSGHPGSPFYREGHEAWAAGAPTPFLPGEPVHRLVLTVGDRSPTSMETR